MALFLCGIVLLVLLIALRLGGCRLLVQVSQLVAAFPDSTGDSGDPGLVRGVPLVSGSSSFRKRFRLNRKTTAHLVGISAHSRPHAWKRLRTGGLF